MSAPVSVSPYSLLRPCSEPPVSPSSGVAGRRARRAAFTDRTDLNQGASILDSVVQAAAGRYGDTFVDVNPYFASHQICDSNSYLHSVNILDIDESYHPTASGQSNAYLPAFTTAAG